MVSPIFQIQATKETVSKKELIVAHNNKILKLKIVEELFNIKDKHEKKPRDENQNSLNISDEEDEKLIVQNKPK